MYNRYIHFRILLLVLIFFSEFYIEIHFYIIYNIRNNINLSKYMIILDVIWLVVSVNARLT